MAVAAIVQEARVTMFLACSGVLLMIDCLPSLCGAAACRAAAGGSRASALSESQDGGSTSTCSSTARSPCATCTPTTSRRRERLNETYKPYLHVFDADGKAPITKGPGGEYPHHRGIFIGWNKIKVGGKTYDRWHMKGGEIVHQKFVGEQNGWRGRRATFTAVTHWNDENGKPLLVEERTIRRPPRPRAVAGSSIDVTSKLTATDGDVDARRRPRARRHPLPPGRRRSTGRDGLRLPEGEREAARGRGLPVGRHDVHAEGRRQAVQRRADEPPGQPAAARGGPPTATTAGSARSRRRRVKAGESLELKYRFADRRRRDAAGRS